MANLQDGTRIYGTASVDTQINVNTNLTVNGVSIVYTGNTTTLPTITLANTGSLTIGNSTTTQTASVISVANSTGNVQITPGTVSINATGTVNAASYTIGTTLVANTLGVYHTGTVNAASHTVGTNLIANTLGVYHTGTVNAASHTVGTGVVANSSGIYSNAGFNSTVNTFTLGTSSIAANGYTRLPNGLLMQWGTQTASVNSSTTATATFPIAFPTTLYSVSVMVLQAGTAADASVANTANTTAIVWKNSNTGVAASKQMYYTAIGV